MRDLVDGTGFLLPCVCSVTGVVGLESLIEVESESCQTLFPSGHCEGGGATLTPQESAAVLLMGSCPGLVDDPSFPGLEHFLTLTIAVLSFSCKERSGLRPDSIYALPKPSQNVGKTFLPFLDIRTTIGKVTEAHEVSSLAVSHPLRWCLKWRVDLNLPEECGPLVDHESGWMS